MVYLDYSATTPVNPEVLESFIKVTRDYIGNANSIHKLGVDAKKLMDAATRQIADILAVEKEEIIYTSGASEANNAAIKGICLKYQNRGCHIITTELEHSSVLATFQYLESIGFKVSYAKLDSMGRVDLDALEKMIQSDTLLVSIASVNSEIGIRQDISAIGKIMQKYPKVFFHSDMTQSVGKEYVDLTGVDLASMSSQKFYGLKGIGVLYKRNGIEIEPLIHGGKSTTIYRSGTPALPLIVSFSKALRLAYVDFKCHYEQVVMLHQYLISELETVEDIEINSNEFCLPHIVNISVLGVKPEVILHALEEEEIYVSTQTACSSNTHLSQAVFAVTKDKSRAESSIRISISHLTTKEELATFISVLKQKISHLKSLGD